MAKSNYDESNKTIFQRVSYLFNAGIFRLGFGYIEYDKSVNSYRLIVYVPNENLLVDTKFTSKQEAKLELVKHLKDNPVFESNDPRWLPLDVTKIANWKDDMETVKNIKKRNPKTGRGPYKQTRIVGSKREG